MVLYNHDKSLQIYFFCLKRRAKNNFLKDVESTVEGGDTSATFLCDGEQL